MPDRKLKILVVDDERIIAVMLAEVFELHGYETATAFSGEEAIGVAHTFQPDILLSDVVMGGVSGPEAAMEILHELPDCKVLLISGNAHYADSPGIKSLRGAHAKGFEFEVLPKPLRASELLSKISQVLFTEVNTHPQHRQGV